MKPNPKLHRKIMAAVSAAAAAVAAYGLFTPGQAAALSGAIAAFAAFWEAS